MIKKTITYTDYNDNQRTEDFYFNLSKAELTEMELSVKGGLTAYIDNIIKAQDTPTVAKLFKDLILKSYGQKSADGRKFMKSSEIVDDFVQTEAYSILYMELATDEAAGAKFINGLIPKDLAAEVAKLEKK